MTSRRLPPLAASMLLAALTPALSEAQTVLDSFGPGESSNTPGIYIPRLFGFSATAIDVRFICPGGFSAQLRSLTVGMYVQGGGPVTVDLEVHDEVAGQPGALLETLQLPLSATTAGVYTVNSITRPLIDGGVNGGPGRPYWVRAIISSGAFISAAIRWQTGPSPAAAIGSATYRQCDYGFVSQCFNAGPTDPLPAIKLIIGDMGACCSTSAYCAVVTPETCAGFGGSFYGYGTACNTGHGGGGIACPQFIFLGGCCVAGGQCSMVTAQDCETANGAFMGTCSTCTIPSGASPCCAADINNSGTISPQDLFDFLGAFFTGCP